MKVHYHKRFAKHYKKLPEKIREQFKKRRQLLIYNYRHPLLDVHPLNPPFEKGSLSINITGDFRAVFLEISTDTIMFTHIGTHHQLFGT